MRTIPGMVVMSPSDDVEARAMVKAAYEHEGPVYMRFGRSAVPVFHEEDGFTFQIGKGEVLMDGSDVAIIATGLLSYEALEAGKALKEAGISARIINMATIKPLDAEEAAEDDVTRPVECGGLRVECEERKAFRFVIARALCARGNLLQQLANSPRPSCYLPLYCEIATSACGLLAMTNRRLLPF